MTDVTFGGRSLSIRPMVVIDSALLVAIAVFLLSQMVGSFQPASSYGSIDPGNFVTRTGLVIEDPLYAVTDQISPSLRYVPFALIAALASPFGVGVETVVEWGAAITAFVITPLSAILVARVAINRLAGYVIAVLALWPLLPPLALFNAPYFTGGWQYAITAPVLLWAVGVAVLDVEGRLPWWGPYLSGTLLGIAGGIQSSTALFGILVVSAVYLSKLNLSKLVRVIVSGAVWGWTVVRPAVVDFYLGGRVSRTVEYGGPSVIGALEYLLPVTVVALVAVWVLDVDLKRAVSSPWFTVGFATVVVGLASFAVYPFLFTSSARIALHLCPLAAIGTVVDFRRA